MFVSCPLGWSNGEEEAEGKKTKKDDTAEQVSLGKEQYAVRRLPWCCQTLV